MQKPLVPNSLKHLINDDGSVSRQLQLLLAALVANTVPVADDGAGTQVAGAVLLPNAATVPQGWTQIDTLVIGGNTYKVISMV